MTRLRMPSLISVAVTAALLSSASPAFAISDPNNPDWPCVQKKIENLSASAVWDGPTIEGIKDWGRNDKITVLVRKLSTRRVPLDKAEAAVQEFAKAEPEATRDVLLTKLFAGLFETVNAQRRSVVGGIEKYQRAQKSRAEELEKQGVDIAALKGDITVDDTAAVPPGPEEEKQYWAGRIFQERQANIPIACELPQIIEERLFALSKSIRGQMTK
jgi:hypothetical protein